MGGEALHEVMAGLVKLLGQYWGAPASTITVYDASFPCHSVTTSNIRGLARNDGGERHNSGHSVP